MWFEILPSAGIILAAMGVPHVAAYVFNKLAFGNGYRRSMWEDLDMLHYIRDNRVSGDPYKVQGLDAIPDN